MKIEVLGTGCPKCRRLEANVRAVLAELGLAAEVEKVTDVAEITRRGVMMTPALAIDGRIRASGRFLGPKELRALLAGGAERAPGSP